VTNPHPRRPMLAVVAVILLAATIAPLPLAGAAAQGPPPQNFKAITIDTAGQSGFVRADQIATGAYDPHLTDQLPLYEKLQYKPGGFHASGTPQTPKEGVRIYRDAFGVPSIYGTDLAATWWGAGYALAQDRLFQMDLFRRAATGRLSEILGEDMLADDQVQRQSFYTTAELTAMYQSLDPDEKTILDSYRDGVNTYLQEALTDPTKTPGEFAALADVPADWTVEDSIAIGILIARSVASEGGQELANSKILLDLVAKYGEGAGKAAFNDVLWPNDRSAPASVPPDEGPYTNLPPGYEPAAALSRSLAFARTLPASAERASELLAAQQLRRAELVRKLGLPRGGSSMWVVSPNRSGNGHTFLFNGPQVGYNVPGLLTEFEVHGGGFDTRGTTVVGAPVVGIGYNAHAAWGVTTGVSDTIDIYVEKLAGDAKHYTFNGETKAMDCRTETYLVRPAPTSPSAPNYVEQEVCRTVHGFVIAVDSTAGVAYSKRMAMWGQEFPTIRGLWMLNKARDIDDYKRAMATVTWNENCMFADDKGNIAYWHPGKFPIRSPLWDLRLPIPGTGEAEWQGFKPIETMPHSINPKRGWLANWNNKPSVDWWSGDSHFSDIPYGQASRSTPLMAAVESLRPSSPETLTAPERVAGLTDLRIAHFRKFLAEALDHTTEATEQKALREILAWDGHHTDENNDGKADSAGLAIFDRWVFDTTKLVVGPVLGKSLGQFGPDSGPFGVVDGHRFEPTPAQNVLLRAFQGAEAPLPQSRNWLEGKPRWEVALAGLRQAIGELAQEFKSQDPASWVATKFLSSVEAQGAGPSPTIAFHDRGSYIHAVELLGPPTVQAQASPKLPATGGGPLAGSAVFLALAALGFRRASARRESRQGQAH